MDDYAQSFSRILIDSGAFSEFNSGKKIDLVAYSEWADRWKNKVDAVAGLDDISGDWRKSLKNYEQFPQGFPTYHEADPSELLLDLLALAKERNGWIGLGMTPPRHGKETWMRETTDRIPEGFHVHGWASRGYTHIKRLDSVDSTNWWRDGMKFRTQMPWLTYAECLEIVVKRYKRETFETRTDDQTRLL